MRSRWLPLTALIVGALVALGATSVASAGNDGREKGPREKAVAYYEEEGFIVTPSGKKITLGKDDLMALKPELPDRAAERAHEARNKSERAGAKRGVAVNGKKASKALRRSLQANGCWRVSIARVAKSFIGRTLWKFWQDKRWCASGSTITSKNIGVRATNVDGVWVYRGLIPGGKSGWFYRYCCGNNKSGHYSFRQGHFEQCWPVWGCHSSKHPWVKIWAHSNATYSKEVGG